MKAAISAPWSAPVRRASSRCAEERLRVSQVNQCTDGAPTCSVADRRSILPPFEPWPRQLDRKLDSYLTGYSTATRQLLDSYSTATRQLLDRDSSTATRQFSTDLDRTPPDCMHVTGRQCVKLDSSTARQTSTDLDRLTTDLDRAEPIRTSLFECPRHFGAKRSGWHGGAIHERHCLFGLYVRALFDPLSG